MDEALQIGQVPLPENNEAALDDNPYPCFVPIIENLTDKVSKTPLRDMETMSIKELRSSTEPINGRYLLLRVCEKPHRNRGIITIVEDHENTISFFCLYNYTVDQNADINDILPVGTIFALKHPSIKAKEEGGGRVVCCECPSNIVFIYGTDHHYELVEDVKWQIEIEDPMDDVQERRTASQWKKAGDSFYGQGCFHLSLQCYLRALYKIEEEGDREGLVRKVHLKMAMAYWKRGYWEAALEFAEMVVRVDPENKQALLHAGRACYQLRKYSEACRYFETCHILNLNVHDEDIKREFHRATKRKKEQDDGEFPLMKLFQLRAEQSYQKLDCADYVGPIKLVDIENRGRGVIATRDLKAGTLLVVSKAIGYTLKQEETAQAQAWEYLVVELGELIAKNPKTFGTIIYDLHPGAQVANDGPAVLFCDPIAQEEPVVDFERLKAILNVNILGDGPKAIKFKSSLLRRVVHRNGCGLFQWLSYFNHSCVANASVNEFNDVVFIRAIRPVKEGQEILVPYVSWELPLPFRVNFCLDLGFVCSCWLCNLDLGAASDEVHMKRERMMHQYEEIYEMVNNNELLETDDVKTVLEKIKKLSEFTKRILSLAIQYGKTYKVGGSFDERSALAPLYALLSMVYANPNANWDNEHEIESHLMTLKFLGFDISRILSKTDSEFVEEKAIFDSSVLNAIARLVVLYHSEQDMEKSKQWYKTLVALENIYSGGDVSVVKYLHPDIENISEEFKYEFQCP